ncbi:MAG: hypothetical protein A2648_02795 [Candidatus Lloydbacteria bacterium RIFCSPHIGHO2_01_FULL_41_20]|uniref:Uncharacterized protein n=1 Tax=Candidatus Lloydbacteria bacterium RIFCSPHIGHO2_01_FULL_41_20 TaxID=1798657 RepID=A0A1G2CTM3_9BACT|nr:MAG: hypothetical protein A2648_02795 [Candidatus Lloydbacteria bacterium RIFCSPHIGHO2_01_FULL_41_20]
MIGIKLDSKYMKSHIKHKPSIKPISTRTFQKEGKWIEKITVTEVILCVCGNKYIKTRDKQIACLRCTYDLKVLKKV